MAVAHGKIAQVAVQERVVAEAEGVELAAAPQHRRDRLGPFRRLRAFLRSERTDSSHTKSIIKRDCREI